VVVGLGRRDSRRRRRAGARRARCGPGRGRPARGGDPVTPSAERGAGPRLVKPVNKERGERVSEGACGRGNGLRKKTLHARRGKETDAAVGVWGKGPRALVLRPTSGDHYRGAGACGYTHTHMGEMKRRACTRSQRRERNKNETRSGQKRSGRRIDTPATHAFTLSSLLHGRHPRRRPGGRPAARGRQLRPRESAAVQCKGRVQREESLGARRGLPPSCPPCRPLLDLNHSLSPMHPPFQDEAVRLVIDECHEHNALMQQIIK